MRNAPDGKRPETVMLMPIRRTEKQMVCVRLLKPPLMLMMIPPNSIPSANAISASVAWAGVPPN